MFARHKLVWLSDIGWQSVLNNIYVNPDAQPSWQYAIDQWRRANWPAIVRRDDSEKEEHEVCLGITLPPNQSNDSKTRIAFRVARSEVKKILDPIRLGAAIESAPPAWHGPLTALEVEIRRQGLSFGVYGSLALQALTGQAYVRPSSDIDLLFYPASIEQLDAGMMLLATTLEVLPLDGEIVFPSGQAVAWKEWLNASHNEVPARVLVKQKNAVRLSTVAELLCGLEEFA